MTRLERHLVFAALLAVALVWVATGEANPSPGRACLRPPFHGITETLDTGEIVGKADARDWGCVGGGDGSARALGVPVPPPPSGVCLQPASPNPATGAVRIRFTIGEVRQVRLTMYGQTRGGGPPTAVPVRTLVDAQLQVGAHEVTWDLRNDLGERVPPGIYRAVMEAEPDVLCGDIEIR